MSIDYRPPFTRIRIEWAGPDGVLHPADFTELDQETEALRETTERFLYEPGSGYDSGLEARRPETHRAIGEVASGVLTGKDVQAYLEFTLSREASQSWHTGELPPAVSYGDIVRNESYEQ
ncbi:MAG TPA: hypothetical protein VJP80_02830 [Candidatus Saccharimonadales bacterium]|nr:hypothetical protein [Candidatus Saccharimonadales bacterium]